MNRTICVTDVDPASLSIRHPLGVNLDLTVTMKKPNGAPVPQTVNMPQFVLLPRSRGGMLPYDMALVDDVNGRSKVTVPGTALTDPVGYNIELYLRKANSVGGDPPLPVSLAAKGVLVTEGSAYTSQGPMGLINIPVVTGPPGPQGAPGIGVQGEPGAPGERGSVWFTGLGAPTMTGDFIVGDMYLDSSTGNVWRWEGAGAWVRQ